MKNFIQGGDVLTVSAPPLGVKSGYPVVIGEIFGVASNDAQAGEVVAVAVEGVFALPKLPGAVATGDKVYWQSAQAAPPKDPGVTKTPDGNKLIGVATQDAAPQATEVIVRLNGAFL